MPYFQDGLDFYDGDGEFIARAVGNDWEMTLAGAERALAWFNRVFPQYTNNEGC